MKKTLLFLIMALASIGAGAQVNIPYQEIDYNVNYHWGLVNVMIAHGTATIQTQGNQFTGTLDGNSIPWNGRILCVSDTLKATMTPGSGLSQETVTYQNGWYLKPKVTDYRTHAFNPNDPANYKSIKGAGTLSASPATMEAITVTSSMLGLYYYFREIDFESMTSGQSITIPITGEGGTTQKVVITYKGKSKYTAGGTTYPTYKCSFEFSYQGKMSGYPVLTQVDQKDRIPLLMSSTLPVGHVEMIYDPK